MRATSLAPDREGTPGRHARTRMRCLQLAVARHIIRCSSGLHIPITRFGLESPTGDLQMVVSTACGPEVADPRPEDPEE